MGRFLETVFRRPWRLLAIVFLIPLVSLAVAYFVTPRTYQASATLWALHRYAVIGTTGPESNLEATPAETQATAVTELLQTRSFALNVAQGANLAPTLHLSADTLADPQKLADALVTEIGRGVSVTARGYNLYEIDYANRSPETARKVIGLVVQNFAAQSTGFSVYEGQRLLEAYQTQLVTAQDTQNKAAAAEARYIAAHPNLTPQELTGDPQYALLHAQTLQAQATVQNIQTTIATINQQISTQGTGSDSLFKTIDEPHYANQPVSRTKTFLLVGGAALGAALAACAIYIILLLRRDRGVYTPLDLQKVTALPVLLQLPQLAPVTVPLLVKGDDIADLLNDEREKANGRYISL